jgi:hypothetical protein
MSQLSFNHLLHLSFAWHTKRKTGEVLRVLDRGAAINNTFQVRVFLYCYLILKALTSRYSFCCSKSSLRSSISLWPLSCSRSSLIGRLRSSFSSSCLHTVRSGPLAFDILAQANLVAASIFLTRWRIWLRRAMNERDTVCRSESPSRKSARTILLDYTWYPHRLSTEL